MPDEKCPKCGAPWAVPLMRPPKFDGAGDPTAFGIYDCGSSIDEAGISESERCLRRQLAEAEGRLLEATACNAYGEPPLTEVVRLRAELAQREEQLAAKEQESQRLRRLDGNDDHPENRCDRCGGRNLHNWYADNEVWNEVVPERGAIVCPICFAIMAEEKGIHPTAWRLSREGDGPEVNILRTRLAALKAIVEKPWLVLVQAERKRQDEKWREQNHNDEKWLAILVEEVGELAQAILKGGKTTLGELVQTAAVGVVWSRLLDNPIGETLMRDRRPIHLCGVDSLAVAVDQRKAFLG